MVMGRSLLAIAVLTMSCSCGGGTAAVVSLFKSRSTNGAVPTTVADVQVVSSLRSSPLSFSFRLTDADGSLADVDLSYVVGASAPVPLLLSDPGGVDGLATSSLGTMHTRSWDFSSQLGAQRTEGLTLLVTVRGTAAVASSPTIDIGNDAPAVVISAQPSGEVVGPVVVEITVSDSGSDPASLLVEYDRFDDGLGWRPATPLGSALSSVTTSPGGRSEIFLWDVTTDEPAAEFTGLLRFTPTDGVNGGASVQTAPLLVDNNAAPVLFVGGSAFVADPDARRGLPVPFELQDVEGDATLLAWQWRTASGTFPALPTSRSQVAAILADPVLRRTYRIATAFPVAEAGTAVGVGSSSLRLPEVALGPTMLGGSAVIGQRLQILRPGSVPAPAAAAWASNPLLAPVAALPVGDGESATVLDRPAPGQWRLREVRLADGGLVRTLSAGAEGDAEGLAAFPNGDYLVGVSQSGLWKLLHVSPTTGSATPWYTTTGLNRTGSIRGLAAPTSTTALVTVADALLAVDARDPLVPVERIVRAGFASPLGVAASPRAPGLAIVAERDWVNPSSGLAEGRLVTVDTTRSLVNTLVVTGITVRRPSSLAVSSDRTRLWFLTDTTVGDGVVELRCVKLQGGGGGPAYALTMLSDTSLGIVEGPLGLFLACDPAQNEVAIGGGVIQSRTITGFDPSTTTATVDTAFAPALAPGSRWRIAQRIDALAGAALRQGSFVWDSADATAGEMVVLRCTPFDTDVGIATTTGVPRPVRGGLQVTPQFVGASPANDGISAVHFADLNGDGLADLATANTTRNSLSIFFQQSVGVFPAAASRTITNLLLTGPTDIAVLDVDGDGDMDIASANAGSNNLSVARQLTASNFTVVPLALSAGAPTAIAAGDLSGDGREDLICACGSANELRIFFQLGAGLFNLLPSRTLTDPNLVTPDDVEVVDLDGDGDLDIVACSQASNRVLVFRQTSPGTFAQPASSTLGGAGLTDAPVDVEIQDFDLDGRPDIAVAARSGNYLALFRQQTDGSFLAAPSVQLSSPTGPVLPRSLRFVDADGDTTPDLVVTDTAGNVLLFRNDPTTQTFQPHPAVLNQGTSLASPTSGAVADVDGDGQVDIAVANEGAANAGLFLQTGPGNFRGQTPTVRIGGTATTPDATSVAVAEANNDGSLDLVVASPTNGTLSVYHQIAPAAFSTDPDAVLGSTATAGARFVTAADVDGDGRADLLSANTTAGTVAVFLRAPSGGWSPTPDLLIGGGTLQAPVHLAAADLDGDGDTDIACADATANRIFVFIQTNGVFGAAPTLVLGTNATTLTPNSVVAADLDLDGDIDLACASSGSSTVTIFLQGGAGVFSATPSRVLGGPATTAQARDVLAVRCNADGLVDIACVSGSGNRVAVFIATSAGNWPASPGTLLTGAEISNPSALAAGDLDGDGLVDVVVGNAGTDRLAAVLQLGNGTFPTAPLAFGGSALTDDASQILLVDMDRDGDLDVVSVHPVLDSVAICFNAH